MKNILHRIAEENKEQETAEAAAIQAEINDPSTKDSRRSFLKHSALGGIALCRYSHQNAPGDRLTTEYHTQQRYE